MAHYAFINEDKIVVEVIPGKDETDTSYDWEQVYSEVRGGMLCKRTSYNTVGGVHLYGGIPFRKNYAGIGYTFDSERDAFIPPKVYDSWILNEDTCNWDSPIPYPNDGKTYVWDEEQITWVEASN